VLLVPRAMLVQPVILVHLELLVLQVLKVRPARLDRVVPMGQLVRTGIQDHRVYKGRWVVQDRQEVLVRLDHQGHQAVSGQLVLQVSQEH